MGEKNVEIAFLIEQNGQNLGWLVFQMDMDLLNREFEISETDLEKFRFKRRTGQGKTRRQESPE